MSAPAYSAFAGNSGLCRRLEKAWARAEQTGETQADAYDAIYGAGSWPYERNGWGPHCEEYKLGVMS